MSNPYNEYRKKIDAIDEQLLELLNQRAEIALKIGEIKRQNQDPVYVPEREKAVLEQLQMKNKGPLKNEDVKTIFEEVIRRVRMLEED